MGGLSVIVLMNILLFLYIFFITIFVAIILYIVISYTFEGISIMCMSKNMEYKILLRLGYLFIINIY